MLLMVYVLSLLAATCHCIAHGAKVDGVASPEIKIEDPRFVQEFDRPRYVPHAHSLSMIGQKEIETNSELAKKGFTDKAGAFDDFDHFDFEKEFSDDNDDESKDKNTTPM